MIKAIIIDDEINCCKTLEIELQMHCNELVDVIGTTTDAKEALKMIPKLKPDLLFLDIEMPWMTGFELLQELTPIDFDVIFVTAYDQYATKAFKFSAIDYLLKPIDDEELKNAILRVNDRNPPFSNKEHYDLFFENINNQSTKFPKIALKTQEGLEFIKVDNIVRIESESNYATIFLLDKSKIVVVKSLKEFEVLLEPHNFFRSHQSHLINPLHIRKFIKADGGYLEMEDGSSASISRDKKKNLIELIDHLHARG